MSVIFTPSLKSFRKPPPPAKSAEDKSFFLKGDNGCSVILIHGLTGTTNEMKFLAAHLHRKGYSVACPNLANHGESLDILKHSRWQDFYGSVRDVIVKGELSKTTGPIFVSGLSMGALLSLLIADEFQDRVLGVSCLAPTLFYDGWNTPGSKYFMPFAKTFLRHMFYFKEEPPYGIKNKTIQQRIHKYYENASLKDVDNVAQYGYPYFPVALLYQLQLLVKHVTKKLPNMRFPVQLVQAKDDDMTSARNSKFIYDRIGSSVKEIVLLYDSYHVVTADQERHIVAEKMESFFSRIAQ